MRLLSVNEGSFYKNKIRNGRGLGDNNEKRINDIFVIINLLFAMTGKCRRYDLH